MSYTRFFPYSLFPVPCSLSTIPCSLFPVPYSLFPTPINPKASVPHPIENRYKVLSCV
ncbi:hypothetical protein [Moorena producens]|uniref:hypothetical protein n=1 Tax=Moorena producens TaxID=1155739 RepID=UPI003C7141A7